MDALLTKPKPRVRQRWLPIGTKKPTNNNNARGRSARGRGVRGRLRVRGRNARGRKGRGRGIRGGYDFPDLSDYEDENYYRDNFASFEHIASAPEQKENPNIEFVRPTTLTERLASRIRNPHPDYFQELISQHNAAIRVCQLIRVEQNRVADLHSKAHTFAELLSKESISDIDRWSYFAKNRSDLVYFFAYCYFLFELQKLVRDPETSYDRLTSISVLAYTDFLNNEYDTFVQLTESWKSAPLDKDFDYLLWLATRVSSIQTASAKQKRIKSCIQTIKAVTEKLKTIPGTALNEQIPSPEWLLSTTIAPERPIIWSLDQYNKVIDCQERLKSLRMQIELRKTDIDEAAGLSDQLHSKLNFLQSRETTDVVRSRIELEAQLKSANQNVTKFTKDRIDLQKKIQVVEIELSTHTSAAIQTAPMYMLKRLAFFEPEQVSSYAKEPEEGSDYAHIYNEAIEKWKDYVDLYTTKNALKCHLQLLMRGRECRELNAEAEKHRKRMFEYDKKVKLKRPNEYPDIEDPLLKDPEPDAFTVNPARFHRDYIFFYQRNIEIYVKRAKVEFAELLAKLRRSEQEFISLVSSIPVQMAKNAQRYARHVRWIRADKAFRAGFTSILGTSATQHILSTYALSNAKTAKGAQSTKALLHLRNELISETEAISRSLEPISAGKAYLFANSATRPISRISDQLRRYLDVSEKARRQWKSVPKFPIMPVHEPRTVIVENEPILENALKYSDNMFETELEIRGQDQKQYRSFKPEKFQLKSAILNYGSSDVFAQWNRLTGDIFSELPERKSEYIKLKTKAAAHNRKAKRSGAYKLKVIKFRMEKPIEIYISNSSTLKREQQRLLASADLILSYEKQKQNPYEQEYLSTFEQKSDVNAVLADTNIPDLPTLSYEGGLPELVKPVRLFSGLDRLKSFFSNFGTKSGYFKIDKAKPLQVSSNTLPVNATGFREISRLLTSTDERRSNELHADVTELDNRLMQLALDYKNSVQLFKNDPNELHRLTHEFTSATNRIRLDRNHLADKHNSLLAIEIQRVPRPMGVTLSNIAQKVNWAENNWWNFAQSVLKTFADQIRYQAQKRISKTSTEHALKYADRNDVIYEKGLVCADACDRPKSDSDFELARQKRIEYIQACREGRVQNVFPACSFNILGRIAVLYDKNGNVDMNARYDYFGNKIKSFGGCVLNYSGKFLYKIDGIGPIIYLWSGKCVPVKFLRRSNSADFRDAVLISTARDFSGPTIVRFPTGLPKIVQEEEQEIKGGFSLSETKILTDFTKVPDKKAQKFSLLTWTEVARRPQFVWKQNFVNIRPLTRFQFSKNRYQFSEKDLGFRGERPEERKTSIDSDHRENFVACATDLNCMISAHEPIAACSGLVSLSSYSRQNSLLNAFFSEDPELAIDAHLTKIWARSQVFKLFATPPSLQSTLIGNAAKHNLSVRKKEFNYVTECCLRTEVSKELLIFFCAEEPIVPVSNAEIDCEEKSALVNELLIDSVLHLNRSSRSVTKNINRLRCAFAAFGQIISVTNIRSRTLNSSSKASADFLPKLATFIPELASIDFKAKINNFWTLLKLKANEHYDPLDFRWLFVNLALLGVFPVDKGELQNIFVHSALGECPAVSEHGNNFTLPIQKALARHEKILATCTLERLIDQAQRFAETADQEPVPISGTALAIHYLTQVCIENEYSDECVLVLDKNGSAKTVSVLDATFSKPEDMVLFGLCSVAKSIIDHFRSDSAMAAKFYVFEPVFNYFWSKEEFPKETAHVIGLLNSVSLSISDAVAENAEKSMFVPALKKFVKLERLAAWERDLIDESRKAHSFETMVWTYDDLSATEHKLTEMKLATVSSAWSQDTALLANCMAYLQKVLKSVSFGKWTELIAMFGSVTSGACFPEFAHFKYFPLTLMFKLKQYGLTSMLRYFEIPALKTLLTRLLFGDLASYPFLEDAFYAHFGEFAEQVSCRTLYEQMILLASEMEKVRIESLRREQARAKLHQKAVMFVFSNPEFAEVARFGKCDSIYHCSNTGYWLRMIANLSRFKTKKQRCEQALVTSENEFIWGSQFHAAEKQACMYALFKTAPETCSRALLANSIKIFSMFKYMSGTKF